MTQNQKLYVVLPEANTKVIIVQSGETSIQQFIDMPTESDVNDTSLLAF